jgi:hypothetical protein
MFGPVESSSSVTHLNELFPIIIDPDDVNGTEMYSFTSFYDSATDYDVTPFIGFTVVAHRIILESRSEFFAVMFRVSDNSSVDMSDTIQRPKVLEHVINFVYCNTITLPMSDEDAFELINLGSMYFLPQLVPICIFSLARTITVQNAVVVLKIALQFDSFELFIMMTELFIAADFEELFADNHYDDICADLERKYFELISNPISYSNVLDRLEWTCEQLSIPEPDLAPFYIRRLTYWNDEYIHFIARNMRYVRHARDWNKLSSENKKKIYIICNEWEYPIDEENSEEDPWVLTTCAKSVKKLRDLLYLLIILGANGVATTVLVTTSVYIPR